MHKEMPEKKKSILIVEDDEDIRESLAAVLDSEGFNTGTAVNGRDALDQLAASAALPSLILLDVMMPIMDGKEFLRMKETDPRLNGIPVVILTAGMHNELAPSVVKLIKKPVELDDLLEVANRFASGEPGLTVGTVGAASISADQA